MEQTIQVGVSKVTISPDSVDKIFKSTAKQASREMLPVNLSKDHQGFNIVLKNMALAKRYCQVWFLQWQVFSRHKLMQYCIWSKWQELNRVIWNPTSTLIFR